MYCDMCFLFDALAPLTVDVGVAMAELPVQDARAFQITSP